MLPLVAYLFFASGINNFAKLPILEKDVLNVDTFSEKTFDNKISILIFLGNNIQKKKGDILNLNQKIYKRFYEFNDFQFIALGPIEIKKQIEDLVGELSTEITEIEGRLGSSSPGRRTSNSRSRSNSFTSR